jgi:membrane-associated protease RseP (regulator of RpoE activity)
MINEPASTGDDRPVQRASAAIHAVADAERDTLRQHVMQVFAIEREPQPDQALVMRDMIALNAESRITVIFEGQLIGESEAAYQALDAALAPMNHTPIFREHGGKHLIYCLRGRVHPQATGRAWINLALFILTVISLLFTGTRIAVGEVREVSEALANAIAANPFAHLWRGLPYALSMVLILGAHELGHYFAARRHGTPASLPYFLPTFPFLQLLGAIDIIGTFGAFIQIKAPFRNRKVMLDVGAAGPLFGLIFAIPIVVIGLATSPVDRVPEIAVLEGNSLLYALSKTIVFGRFLPDGGFDVFINQMASAGWAGLLVTGLNLLPVGQLDGGHILYALLGKRARRLYLPTLAGVLLLVLLSPMWLVWGALIFFLGRIYAVPLDDITPLDDRRRYIALLGLALFVVTLVPVPLSVVDNTGLPLPQESVWLALAGALIGMLWLRLKR